MFDRNDEFCRNGENNLAYNNLFFPITEGLFLINIVFLIVLSFSFSKFAATQFQKSDRAIVSPKDFSMVLKLNVKELFHSPKAYIETGDSQQKNRNDLKSLSPILKFPESLTI